MEITSFDPARWCVVARARRRARRDAFGVLLSRTAGVVGSRYSSLARVGNEAERRKRLAGRCLAYARDHACSARAF